MSANYSQIKSSLIKLIKSDDHYWVEQRNELKYLLKLMIKLSITYDFEKPSQELLNELEEVKSWRTINLNTPENIKRVEYKNIVENSMKLKLTLMSCIFHQEHDDSASTSSSNKSIDPSNQVNDDSASTSLSNKSIDFSHYTKLDEEFRKKYKDYVGEDPDDKTVRRYTEAEIIEQYAKNIAFWSIHQVNLGSTSESIEKVDGGTLARAAFTSTAQVQVYSTIQAKFNKSIQDRIFKRAKELANENVSGSIEYPANTSETILYLKPHSKEWFLQMDEMDHLKAVYTMKVINQTGSIEVCSVCGDHSMDDFRIDAMNFNDGTPMTMRLCTECKEIRENLSKSLGVPEKYIPIN